MRRTIFFYLLAAITALFLAALVLTIVKAEAAMVTSVPLSCFTTKEALIILQEVHKKKPIAYGMNIGGAVVQLWINDNGDYTVLASRSDGFSCELSSGTEWTGINSVLKGKNL